jgi:hypothetical protein
VRLGRHPDSEVHVGLGVLDLAARADGADALALLERGADPNTDGPEMDERDRVPVLGANGHAETRMWQRAGKRDHAARGCAHVRARERPDVDTAVLSAQVWIALGEKAPDDRPVDGPAPGARCRGKPEGGHYCGQQQHQQSVANFENHEPAR